MKTSRLEAFSDGVIAIAITLLVLEIHVPEIAPGESLWRALGHQWPSYVGFVVSFLTIGIMWVNHHALCDRIAHVDRGLLYWNLYLLGCIVALPFTTALMARYLRDEDASRVATTVYCLSLGAAGVGFAGLWWHLSRHPNLMAAGSGARTAKSALRRTLKGPVLYLLAALLSLVSPPLALAITAGLAVYFAVTSVAGSAERAQAAEPAA